MAGHRLLPRLIKKPCVASDFQLADRCFSPGESTAIGSSCRLSYMGRVLYRTLSVLRSGLFPMYPSCWVSHSPPSEDPGGVFFQLSLLADGCTLTGLLSGVPANIAPILVFPSCHQSVQRHLRQLLTPLVFFCQYLPLPLSDL